MKTSTPATDRLRRIDVHQYAWVVLDRKPLPEDLESAVSVAMDPYKWHVWDGYQIGGRWSGVLRRHPNGVASLKSALKATPFPPYAVFAPGASAFREHWDADTRTFIDHPEYVTGLLALLPEESTVVVVDYHW